MSTTYREQLIIASYSYMIEFKNNKLEFDNIEKLNKIYQNAKNDMEVRKVDDDIAKTNMILKRKLDKKEKDRKYFKSANKIAFDKLRRDYRKLSNKFIRNNCGFALESICYDTYEDKLKSLL
jgi:hypothetical protein